jgi:crotonobetainyl-CoA:carnitine CoA-transferase CaiB-like acyl-CoA transferase
MNLSASADDSMSATPLHGVRAVEVAHWMAGPAAGGVLQDWGAEVIKVEPHGGEPMRHIWGSMGADPDAPNGAFISANRAKKSIELDLHTDQDRATLHRLLAEADIFLTNLRPGALIRLGLSPQEVAERHPRLVYCSLTAYGWGGPDQDKAGYDLAAFFGRTGIAHEITTQGTPPAALLQGLGDTFSAMTAVAGILAALVARLQTGRGSFVEASLLRTGMWALAGELGVQALGGHPRPPRARENCSTPMYNSYRTKDDRWFYLVGVQAARQLPKVLGAIGRPELMADERFSSARAIAANRAEFIPLLDQAFASKTLAEWDGIFTEFDVFWAPVQTPAEVVDDRQARAVGAWIHVDEVDADSVDAPIRFNGVRRTSVPRPPRSGEHTSEILGQLGPGPGRSAGGQESQ